MNRTLILMRHGKSGYPAGVTDHDRPLAQRGRREATIAGEWFAEEGLEVDAALCSTATRTRQTLERTGVDAPTEYLDAIYGGTADEVLAAIRRHAPDDAETVLVVGHEPGMPQTAQELDPSADIDHFPTSAYAVLRVQAPWERLGLSPDDTSTLIGMRVPRPDES
ncbi:SixA phosphatase family protein [Williamsia sterculiae]|uniref:Phosphohistidine phosphatase n=1 Tax=Williamsia sterculiae TaxID=1344003 RepID=A0A1N7GNX3_9NOCA|nr:histidine phosphatase family protein [Williamsia sterculiae]SIS14297.1 phosphohistidine phosphatase [Williamsia sterculiae]